MGLSILAGLLAALESHTNVVPLARSPAKWDVHTPGTLTPAGLLSDCLPSRFIACVRRAESATQLLNTFQNMGAYGGQVEVLVGQNTYAVQQSDLVILWCISSYFRLNAEQAAAASRRWRTPS